MAMQAWLSRRLRRTYESTQVTILFNGEGFYLRRGMKQGCPDSRALWALLFDPIIR